jgi:hypothetical protein
MLKRTERGQANKLVNLRCIGYQVFSTFDLDLYYDKPVHASELLDYKFKKEDSPDDQNQDRSDERARYQKSTEAAHRVPYTHDQAIRCHEDRPADSPD